MNKQLALALCCVMLASCSRRKNLVEIRDMMSTRVEIKVVCGGGFNMEPAWNEIGRLEKLLSPYSPGSDLSEISRLAGESAVRVSSETAAVMRKAMEISRITCGIYDPTVFPLVKLWDVNSANPSVPAKEDILKALEFVDYRQVKLDGTNVFLQKKGMRLDLSNMAKGHIADKAAKSLMDTGAYSVLVNAGGDIRAAGGKTWKVGIQHPRKKDGVLAVIKVRNCAVSTSGDYERYFVKGGKRYHHIFDVRTGYPAANSIGATVVAPQCALSNALALSAFILGPEKGMELVKKFPGSEAIIIDNQGNVFVSEGLKKEVKIRKIDVDLIQ
ncbi:MAG: FAD:protein FMN transferase [Elusimicrobiota bacterium]